MRLASLDAAGARCRLCPWKAPAGAGEREVREHLRDDHGRLMVTASEAARAGGLNFDGPGWANDMDLGR